MDATNNTINTDWWRGAIIYQIYPRSYQDTNHDGIGDLIGITQRLPYIASLGVDAIWISPFCKSPMKDFGYDVSDYNDIEPMFGTLDDFDALIQTAHEFDLKILMDLVISHTSDQHSWFIESCSSKDNPKADWYVWADAKADGTAPNNWLSIFGNGSSWQWDGKRMQYYLHNFLTSQPDLNLHNPDVQAAIFDVTRFWLKRGVDGFRLDTINFYFHDQQLRDNPVLPKEQRNSSITPEMNPYNWQDHIYDKNRPENLDFLRKFRAVLDEFPGTTAVGEVGDAQHGMEIQAAYTSGDDRVHMCYDFAFLSPQTPTPQSIAQTLDKFEHIIGDGWACWAFSNHDVVRHRSRWSCNEQKLRLYTALLMSLRGTICIYQGEELGFGEADIPFEALKDPFGIVYWPDYKGRDGCRTPMVWESNALNGGFSEHKTWLPVSPEHLPRAVETQEKATNSTLAFYRRMIAFRQANKVLQKGTYELVEITETYLAFIRAYENKKLFCAFNFGSEAKIVTLPEGTWQHDENAPFSVTRDGNSIKLTTNKAFFAHGDNKKI